MKHQVQHMQLQFMMQFFHGVHGCCGMFCDGCMTSLTCPRPSWSNCACQELSSVLLFRLGCTLEVAASLPHTTYIAPAHPGYPAEQPQRRASVAMSQATAHILTHGSKALTTRNERIAALRHLCMQYFGRSPTPQHWYQHTMLTAHMAMLTAHMLCIINLSS